MTSTNSTDDPHSLILQEKINAIKENKKENYCSHYHWQKNHQNPHFFLILSFVFNFGTAFSFSVFSFAHFFQSLLTVSDIGPVYTFSNC